MQAASALASTPTTLVKSPLCSPLPGVSSPLSNVPLSVYMVYRSTNFTRAAVKNGDWMSWWKGHRQPLPPPPPPPPPWTPILPKGPCTRDEDCSLNGECNRGVCVCRTSWEGHNCERLRLQPLKPVAGYGEAPNVTAWGGSIYPELRPNRSLYHLYVTEETDGRGLASWVTNSRIVHAVSESPYGNHFIVLFFFSLRPRCL